MQFDELKSLIETRQACRDFDGKKVDMQTLEKICDLARLSPSACNSQPWKMHIVNDGQIFNEVMDALTKGGRNQFLKQAGAFICLSEKANALKPDVEKKFGISFFVQYDIGELIAYITLIAESLGVKTCVIGWMDGDKMGKVLELKDKERCNIVVALGYSNAPIREKKRKSKEEVVIIR